LSRLAFNLEIGEDNSAGLFPRHPQAEGSGGVFGRRGEKRRGEDQTVADEVQPEENRSAGDYQDSSWWWRPFPPPTSFVSSLLWPLFFSASPETFETPRVNPSADEDGVKIEESSVGDTPSREDVQSSKWSAQNWFLPLWLPASTAVCFCPDCSTAAQLHLDQFLSLHTSEDNAAFEEIMEMTERRRRLKLHWMFTAEKDHNDQLLARLEASMPSGTLALTDGTATSASTGPSQLASKADLLALRPSAPDNWTYVAKNAVMWVPDGREPFYHVCMSVVTRLLKLFLSRSSFDGRRETSSTEAEWARNSA